MRARSRSSCRSVSAAWCAARASGALAGNSSRERSQASVAAITSHSPQQPSDIADAAGDGAFPRASAASSAAANAPISSAIGRRARSIRSSRAISSSQSSGHSKPLARSTGASVAESRAAACPPNRAPRGQRPARFPPGRRCPSPVFGASGVVARTDVEAQRRPGRAQTAATPATASSPPTRNPPGRPPPPRPRDSGSAAASSATWRSASVVPQCCHSHASASG